MGGEERTGSLTAAVLLVESGEGGRGRKWGVTEGETSAERRKVGCGEDGGEEGVDGWKAGGDEGRIFFSALDVEGRLVRSAQHRLCCQPHQQFTVQGGGGGGEV